MNYAEEMQKDFIKIMLLILTMILLLVGYVFFAMGSYVLLKQDLQSHQKSQIMGTYQAHLLKPEEMEPVEEPKEQEFVAWFGTASYYSEDGCIGCSATLTMANGKRFDENAMTIAFNRVPLGTMVEIRNQENNQRIIAEVTDRGGFEELDRIADLSKGVKEAINCTDLCLVEISLLEETHAN